MRKLAVLATLLAAAAVPAPRAAAGPIPCLICGSVPLVAPGIEGTVSFAVISGAAFAAEVGAHAIGFFGLVPSGTLGPAVLPAASDFVYLYQLVNDEPTIGAAPEFITSWTISGGSVGSASGAITAGTRLESTLFVDPNVGPPALITAGPVLAPTALGLTAGPLVNFENGLADPTPALPVAPWGPCLGSGAVGVNCSDGTADLLPTSVSVYGWSETPSLTDLDPLWSGSVIWFASPFGPVPGITTITELAGLSASGAVPVPGVPEPGTLAALGTAIAGMLLAMRRRRPV